jgi:hypothetical protein
MNLSHVSIDIVLTCDGGAARIWYPELALQCTTRHLESASEVTAIQYSHMSHS